MVSIKSPKLKFHTKKTKRKKLNRQNFINDLITFSLNLGYKNMSGDNQ